MNKHREALRYFRLEINEEFLNCQKDAPDGMFDELNKNISLLNEAILKAEKVDEIEEEIGCPLEVVFRALRDGVYCIDYQTKEMKLILRGFSNLTKGDDGLFGFVDDRPIYMKKNEYGLEMPSFYAWKDYKRTWFLKSDKSE